MLLILMMLLSSTVDRLSTYLLLCCWVIGFGFPTKCTSLQWRNNLELALNGLPEKNSTCHLYSKAYVAMGAMYFVLNSRFHEKRLIKNTFPMSSGFTTMNNLPEKKSKTSVM